MPQQIVLMDKSRIDRTLKRLAIQLWEQQQGEELVIIGLNERGFATAKALISHLDSLADMHTELHQYKASSGSSGKPLPNCTEKHVLIVDDVIFSGKTMFSALSTICHSNEPKRTNVLCLVDRGHRTYPVLSELTGIKVPTKFGEHIEVILNEGNLEQVVLFQNTD